MACTTRCAIVREGRFATIDLDTVLVQHHRLALELAEAAHRLPCPIYQDDSGANLN